MRVLFTSQPGSGHWRPLAPLAQALEAAGHEVAFATTPSFCPLIAEHGFRCFPVGVDDTDETAEREQRKAGSGQASSVWVDVFAGTRAMHSLPNLLAVCRDWHPSVLVREVTEFGGCIAAELLGLPHAAVQVSAFRPHLHQLIAESLNRLRVTVGLKPDPNLDMLYRYLLLVPGPPSYHDLAAPLPPTAHAIRHVSFDQSKEGQPPGWIGRLSSRPTVYATLGTAYNRTPGIFQAILAGLREEQINLILTIGGNRDPADFGEQPEHVYIERYIPQSLLFSHCDLVIIHGGFGTVLTALDHALPMVVIPIAADQPDNAMRLAELGLARVIAPNRRIPGAIREATQAVLQAPSYRRNAERLRDEMHALPGPEHAVELLERLVTEKQPLRAEI